MKRLSSILSNEVLQKIFGVDLKLGNQLIQKYAISPGESIPIVIRPEYGVRHARWGISRLNNDYITQIEYQHVHVKPSFRMAFRQKRCIALADSYYDWLYPDAVPERIFQENGEPLLIPALYSEDECSVVLLSRLYGMNHEKEITCEPLIFSAENAKVWLAQVPVADLIELLNQNRTPALSRMATNNKIKVSGYSHRSLHQPQSPSLTLFK